MKKKKEICREELRERARLLPELPGVYRFYDSDGEILYIGKAKSLRSRVLQYFQSPENLQIKSRIMVRKIERIEHTIVESETDALLLENNLIKEYQPRYNIMLKDGKSYPWITIRNEPFPRVYLTRRTPNDGSLYFGPYVSVHEARALVELISSLYYLRDCKLNLKESYIKEGRYKPCLKYHINRCKAPCVGLFSSEEYNAQIEQIKALLKGDSSSLIREFKEKMERAAEELNFEEAHSYKEKLELLRNHNSKSVIVNKSISNVDVFSLVEGEKSYYGNYIRVVNGSIIQALNQEIKLPLEESREAVMSRFITTIHDKFGSTSKELILSDYPDSESLIKRATLPKRGDKHYLLQLSLKNATLFMKERVKQEESLRPKERGEAIITAIQQDLSLKEAPHLIEAFDISNIQGSNSVGSCVVFRDGLPERRSYRHFTIKEVEQINDYESIKEVVTRRYKRVLKEEGELPQLIVVDGGKGQLRFALEALEELGIEERVEIIGIAERMQEIIVPGDPHPHFLDKNSTTLRTIMQIRDEAHRFALRHHRGKRSREQIQSQLRTIKGIGEARERALIRHFGSVKRVKEASYEELIAVVGESVAKAIIDHFRP